MFCMLCAVCYAANVCSVCNKCNVCDVYIYVYRMHDVCHEIMKYMLCV